MQGSVNRLIKLQRGVSLSSPCSRGTYNHAEEIKLESGLTGIAGGFFTTSTTWEAPKEVNRAPKWLSGDTILPIYEQKGVQPHKDAKKWKLKFKKTLGEGFQTGKRCD